METMGHFPNGYQLLGWSKLRETQYVVATDFVKLMNNWIFRNTTVRPSSIFKVKTVEPEMEDKTLMLLSSSESMQNARCCNFCNTLSVVWRETLPFSDGCFYFFSNKIFLLPYYWHDLGLSVSEVFISLMN